MVSPVGHSIPSSLLCTPAVFFGHATSISSHKDISKNLQFLDLNADKGLQGIEHILSLSVSLEERTTISITSCLEF